MPHEFYMEGPMVILEPCGKATRIHYPTSVLTATQNNLKI